MTLYHCMDAPAISGSWLVKLVLHSSCLRWETLTPARLPHPTRQQRKHMHRSAALRSWNSVQCFSFGREGSEAGASRELFGFDRTAALSSSPAQAIRRGRTAVRTIWWHYGDTNRPRI